MAEVKLQEGESIESALRRFKRKVQQEDIIKDIKKHSFYLKPGDSGGPSRRSLVRGIARSSGASWSRSLKGRRRGRASQQDQRGSDRWSSKTGSSGALTAARSSSGRRANSSFSPTRTSRTSRSVVKPARQNAPLDP